jgi:hypothetical protein
MSMLVVGSTKQMETKTEYKLKKTSILQLSTYITKYKTMQTIVLVLSLPRIEKMTILIKKKRLDW